MQETMSNDYEKVPKGSNNLLRNWYLKQLEKKDKRFFKPNFNPKTEIIRDEYEEEKGMKL